MEMNLSIYVTDKDTGLVREATDAEVEAIKAEEKSSWEKRRDYLANPEFTKARYKLLAYLLEQAGDDLHISNVMLNSNGEVWLLLNDVFFWACSDSETLEPEDYQRFMDEAEKVIVKDEDARWFSFGWGVRQRNLRPQKPYMKYITEDAHALFERMGFKIMDLPHYGKMQGWEDDDKLIKVEE